LCLTAINKGRREIVLNGAGFNLSDGRNIPFINDIFGHSFPTTLEGRNQFSVFFELSPIKELLKENPQVKITKVWFRDATENYHKAGIPQKVIKFLR